MWRGFFNDVVKELDQYYDRLVVAFPKFILALLIVVISWFIARAIRRLTDQRLKKRMEDPLLAEFLATMTRSVVFIIGLLFAFRVMGFGGVTASILAGAGISAFIIGFALRDIGENFLAGILMAFKRPFRVGDFVETSAIKGRVEALSIRETHIKTPDGRDVFVPNANIIKNPLINFTVDGFLRYDYTVNLSSGSDYENTMQKIEAALHNVEGILKKRRKPDVYISGMAPGRVDITVSFWIDNFSARKTSDKIRSDAILAVQKVLDNQV